MITGGAGFIGSNLADRLLGAGENVLVYDNLSRSGTERNMSWLEERHGERVRFNVADISDCAALERAVRGASMVYHFAAQVAVTTSVADPIRDFESNMRGTLNLLEAIRSLKDPPPLVYTSTNKVYGALEDVVLNRKGTRYEPADVAVHVRGIAESRPLRFHSPYGCSKGAADQYVLDYARIYGLTTVVFRMSCIYGPRQFGTEDQGWVAHFLISTIRGEPIIVFGNGMQVRDVLHIDDLVDAFLLAGYQMDRLSGEAFNIGGGPQNTLSLIELLNLIGEIHGAAPQTSWDVWRPGDQRYYASDFGKFKAATGWHPKVGVSSGIRHLYQWLLDKQCTPLSMDKEKAFI
jgi:CDP-paratose 2-epimerase